MTSKTSKESFNYGEINPAYIKHECLHQIFEQASDKYPENTALIFEKNTLTYSQLEKQANSLAHYLRSLGVTTGSSVGLCLPKSLELYVSMLAILKAGASYIPLDPSYPSERIAYILENSEVKIVLSDTQTSKNISHQGTLVNVDQEFSRINTFPTVRITPQEIGLTPEDLAYVIYTSGSTGKPKGVMIPHKGICHLVRASQEIYHINSQDRVYQGISVSFDFSLEEIWMAFANGAALIPATTEMANAGPGLSKLLTAAGVTAISCVPTLLTMLDEDIPTLRFINVGGEDCPQALIAKWHKPGRLFFNTYGPTETSVNATYALCDPTKKVTIGKPLPNFSAYILDENMQQVPLGEEGELYIGGIGLAKGYVNRPDLTAERFVTNPFLPHDPTGSSKLYKTGDLVKFDDEGNIVFLGRIDTQVKIRGFRIELSEIETVLANISDVKTAIVSVYEKVPGLQALVAYVLPANEKNSLEINNIRKILKQQLPAYMVPQYIEIITHVPQLPNGKIDRKNLPLPATSSVQENARDFVHAQSATEKTIAAVWAQIFGKKEISLTDHFFYDLGGHSLFAAKTASQLRNTFPNISVSDIYAKPTIKELAAALEKTNASKSAQAPEKKSAKKSWLLSKKKFAFFSLAQAGGIYLLYFLTALPFIAFYSLSKMRRHTHAITMSTHSLLTYLALVLLAYFPFMVLFSIAAKWLLLGRFKQGEYPLWSFYYFRFWLVRRIQALVPLQYLSGTPFMGVYLRLMGAKIGKNTYIGTYIFQAHDLLSIGDNASVGVDSHLLGYTIEDGLLKIAPIVIGTNCYVGNHCVLSHGTIMENASCLDSQAMLATGSRVPQGQTWTGSPAQKDTQPDSDIAAMISTTQAEFLRAPRLLLTAMQALLIIFLPIITALAYIPIGAILLLLYTKIHYWSLLATPILAPLYIFSLSAEIIILKKIFLNNVKTGIYKLNSFFYVRKWFVDQLMSMSLLSMNTLFATLYTPYFLRRLGVKIGKRVEISTVSNISPNLLEVQDEGFVADAACLGASKMHLGRFMLAPTTIGKRTFVGNAALVASNRTLGDNCLIGVLSTSPKKECPNDTSWLGLPPIYLPQRDINTSFSQEETYAPTPKLYFKRYLIEFFRVTLPTAINAATIFASLLAFIFLYRKISHAGMVMLLPLLILLAQLTGALLVILLKWLVVGKYIPRIKPLWSTFVWRSELITGLYEDVIAAPLLHNLLGSPFAPLLMRALGVKMGAQIYLDTTYMTEFDLVSVGSGSAINFNCSLQTHLFEDRVMKMSYVQIEKNCSVGNRAVVLYDTKMHSGACISNLSLLMKGETLPENTYWSGVPAKHSKPVDKNTLQKLFAAKEAFSQLDFPLLSPAYAVSTQALPEKRLE